jgi:hypothetical protein
VLAAAYIAAWSRGDMRSATLQATKRSGQTTVGAKLPSITAVRRMTKVSAGLRLTVHNMSLVMPCHVHLHGGGRQLAVLCMQAQL